MENPTQGLKQAAPSPFLTGLVGVLLLLGAMFSLLQGCQRPSVTEGPTMLEYPTTKDLTALARAAGMAGPRQGPVVWTLAEVTRRALFLHPPGEISFEIPVDARDCVLHFGIGIKEEVWSQSDGAEFAVELRGTSGSQVLFREFLDTRNDTSPRWKDRSLELPNARDPQQVLFLTTGVGPHGDASYDHAAFSSPYLECTQPRSMVAATDGEPQLILLVSIDTLRADHLGLYGYPRKTSPNLDALAATSAVFDAAFAPAPFTLPSHGSMLTGLNPEKHRAGFDHPMAPLEDGPTTLAESLRDKGYSTLAITSGGLVGREFGLSRGFDEWHEFTRAELATTIPLVLHHLDRDGGRKFIFLHTYDVHGPYRRPIDRPGFGPTALNSSTDADWQRAQDTRYHNYLDLERFDGVDAVVDAYDSGIHRVDTQLGRLLEYLKATDRFDNALIVVTSDHGETLFDHARYFGHSWSLLDHEVKIPLIVKRPRTESGMRRNELVTLVDVAATVRAAAGLEATDVSDGQDLFSDPPREPRTMIEGGSTHLGAVYVRSDRWKLISAPSQRGLRDRQGPMGPSDDLFPSDIEVYSLAHDPKEQRPLGSAEINRDEDFKQLLQKLRDLQRPGETPTASELSDDKAAELEALGYL